MSDEQIAFLKCDSFAVAGASNNREKYGNKVFRALQEFAADDERSVYPIHPALDTVEGITAFANITALPSPASGQQQALSIITPPAVTLKIVEDAIAAGIQHIWMQPGAEHPDAIEAATAARINVLANGPCILVALKVLDL